MEIRDLDLKESLSHRITGATRRVWRGKTILRSNYRLGADGKDAGPDSEKMKEMIRSERYPYREAKRDIHRDRDTCMKETQGQTHRDREIRRHREVGVETER